MKEVLALVGLVLVPPPFRRWSPKLRQRQPRPNPQDPKEEQDKGGRARVILTGRDHECTDEQCSQQSKRRSYRQPHHQRKGSDPDPNLHIRRPVSDLTAAAT